MPKFISLPGKAVFEMGLASVGSLSKFEVLKSGTIELTGGYGAAKAETYTFEKPCNFVAVASQANHWNDMSLLSISGDSVQDFTSTANNIYHSEANVGGAMVVATGKAKAGDTLTITARVRTNVTATIKDPYIIYSV